MKRELAEMFQRPVDLVPQEGLKPVIREAVLSSAQVMYASWKVGFRNIAVHEYFAVLWQIVLNTAMQDVPELRKNFLTILENEYQGDWVVVYPATAIAHPNIAFIK